MTQEEAKALLPIIQAYSEGKTIEYLTTKDKWVELKDPLFNYNANMYRIKLEPKYRPFKNAEECWQEMQKHQPFGWVSLKNKNSMTFIYYISNNSVQIHDGCTFHGWNFNYEEMFDKYIFADGTPFGIKEE